MTLALCAPFTLAATPQSASAVVEEPKPAAVTTAARGDGMNGYRLFDLNPSGQGKITSLDGISDDGHVIGTILDPMISPAPVPFAWAPGSQMEMMPINDPDLRHWPAGVAANGTVYGRVGVGDGRSEGYVYRSLPGEGAVYNSPEVLTSSSYEVIAANNRGQILVGTSPCNAILTEDGALTPLPCEMTAEDMNESGTVAGFVSHEKPDGTSASEPAIWQNGALQGLGLPPDFLGGVAMDINNAGDVLVQAGNATTAAWFVRSKAGVWTKLDAPKDTPEGHGMVATSLNDRGEVVGAVGNTGLYKAVLWSNGSPRVLNALLPPVSGWRLDHAELINKTGIIVGRGAHGNNSTIWAAIPIDPVIFVHGAGASRLSAYENDKETDELWIGCHIRGGSRDRNLLSLFPKDAQNVPRDIRPVDALQHEHCDAVSDLISPALNIYGTLLDTLRGPANYREYKVDGHTERRTTEGCDLTQSDQSGTPNLFVFAYDWRKSNAESAEKLADFIGCVRKFWPNRKVDVLTHSMGGIVTRRYILDHPQDSHIDRMVTLGAPWLGAPKLVNVLLTGDFIKADLVNGPPEVIKRVAGSFPATHQLMASRIYGDASSVPVVREDGWDLNGKNGAEETYSYQDVKELANSLYEDSNPGDNADEFQSKPGQVDWREDTQDIKYTHIVGLQAGANTIGTIVANRKPICTGSLWWKECAPENFISQDLICGDGTVPLISAERAGRGVDYNAANAEVLVFRSEYTWSSSNFQVEHTGMSGNPAVLNAVLDRLYSIEPQGQADHSGLGRPGADTESCVNNAGTQSGLAAGATAAPDPAMSLRYVSVLGGTELTVTDGQGHTTDPEGGTAGYVDGVTRFLSNRDDAGMVTMPAAGEETFRTRITATGKPLQLTLLEGTQQRPTVATRWIDIAVAKGTAVELTTRPDGTDVLRADEDGDGRPEKVIPPTVRLAGADAADVTDPEVTVDAVAANGSTSYVVSASDTGSGVADIAWSTDGRQFSRYEGPLSLNPATTPTLTVFAEDRAGNRSAPVEVKLADLKPSLVTTAMLDPAPAGAGWSTGDVKVTLKATAGGSPVAKLTYRASGAQTVPETSVNGAQASFTITATGATNVTFWATAADGTVERKRTVPVRLDKANPTTQIKTPADTTVVPEIKQFAGTASDDASGVAKVRVELRDSKGRYWDGDSWTTSQTWLPTAGSTAWSRTTGLPSGENLPTGGYRLRTLVSDEAGHEALGATSTFTVAPDAKRGVYELRAPDGFQAGAAALNDRGVAAGVYASKPLRWSNGKVAYLDLPPGASAGHAEAVDEDGLAYGYADWLTHDAPVRWELSGTPTVLDLLPNHTRGAVAAVSRDGRTAVGSSYSEATRTLPVRWSGTTVAALPLLTGAANGTASGANSAGVIVGTQRISAGNRAVVWSGGQVRNLGTLPGHLESTANAVNDLGVVVGTSVDGPADWNNTRTFGYVYADGTMRRLDTAYTGAKITSPEAVNNLGQIVGQYTLSNGQTRAFLAEPGKDAVDLNTLLPPDSGWQLLSAKDINEHGQILGFGNHNGKQSAFLMTVKHAPVAEDVTATTVKGQAANVTLNAFDPDVLDTITLRVLDGQGPAHGTVSAVKDGQVTYTPAAGFTGTDTFTYVADDGDLVSAPAMVTVKVEPGDNGGNQPPTVHDVTATTPESTPVKVTLKAEDPDGDSLSYRVVQAPGHGAVSGTGPDVTYTPEQGWTGTDTFTWTASDGKEEAAPAKATITVTAANRPPTVSIEAPANADEGSAVQLKATATDPDGDKLTWKWSTDTGTLAGDGDTVKLTVADGPADAHVTVEVSDGQKKATATATVRVNNVAPKLGEVSTPAAPQTVGSAIELSVRFTDPGADTHTCAVDWKDGGTSPGTVADGTCRATHAYAKAGLYHPVVTVTDDDQGSGTATAQAVVVYDPSAGFVTGGGWINSPAGAYKANPALTGKANFGFVSKYKEGTSTPTGNTEFDFHAGNLNFKAKAHDWMVVSGTRAQYKGSGTINGRGEYVFELTAIDDGKANQFRIKIWDAANGTVVYDNGEAGTALGGGNIAIHDK
ncbi:Ig-like domain-containing protein [Acrocarpospora catenulata]|uniref:Ig-like domain-containing protein n=1 Tax=Acrocarpospora catenulata TaxID=2836182 RepID=UPI001BDB4C2A|nr:Ig-like domain-containing protein [Acrocarpospora catenulata]